MSDTTYDSDAKNDALQNNISEAEASITIDPTANVNKSIDPKKQEDSEGMCIEE